MSGAIINDRVAGTRITIWDIFHYLENGRSPEYIAGILPVSVEQVRAAITYIEAHKEQVLAGHRRIEERIRRGNLPEIEAKLASRMQREWPCWPGCGTPRARDLAAGDIMP